MENTTSPNAANDFDPDETERLENWRSLQIALGLVPDELPVPASEVTSPPVAAPKPREPAPPAPAEREPFGDAEVEAFAAEVLSPSAEASPEPTLLAEGEEQDVEVGDAPEEVPEEPGDESGAPGDKKRRRRRRRRRRGPEDTEQAPTAEVNGEPSAAEDLPAGAEDDEEFEDDEEEIEPISIPDWNVPTWQDLIDALYRPER